MFAPVSIDIVGDAYHIWRRSYSPAVTGLDRGRFPVRQDEQIDPCQSGDSPVRKNQ
jgi:hypothetical protein